MKNFTSLILSFASLLLLQGCLSTSRFVTKSEHEATKRELTASIGNLQDSLQKLSSRLKSLEVPLGTIVASSLDYKDFCLQNGLSYHGAVPNVDSLDYADTPWVPADGRYVRNSRLQKAGISVPDLRGVFLRGLNDMDLANPRQTAFEAQKDPETREYNSFQMDAVGQHNNDPGKFGVPALYRSGNGNVTQQYAPSGGTAPCTNCGPETRPKNRAVYYYIKIN
jgi:hypothetical protein